MIEIPEAINLSKQINKTLVGKTIKHVIANNSPHKFAWFYQNKPEQYHNLLENKVIEKALAYGGLVEITAQDVKILIGDGAYLRYVEPNQLAPKKHQLFIQFIDNSSLIGTVQMYGGLWVFKDGEFLNPYYQLAQEKIPPIKDAFDFDYFKKIIYSKKKLSVKAALATEQRIPGLGNGVLQDILFNAKIHPKRKIETINNEELLNLCHNIKSTLKDMITKGGRNTEKDLFGNYGGYLTLMSKNTINTPCINCGTPIIKDTFLGGSIYYCENCQQL